MLRLTVGPEDYLMIGDDIKIIFLGGSKNHTRIMLDIPKELNVVRSKVVENSVESPEEKAKLPHYHAVPDLPEKYRKKRSLQTTRFRKSGNGSRHERKTEN